MTPVKVWMTIINIVNDIIKNYILLYFFLIIYSPLIAYLHINNISPLRKYIVMNKYPLGKEIYGYLILLTSPYTSTINPIIDKYNDTYCESHIEDKKFIRNPYNSIHAIALTNLGELTSALLVLEELKKNNKRGIITNISTEYFKKANGKITAISNINSFKNEEIKCDLYDEKKNLICTVKTKWKICARISNRN